MAILVVNGGSSSHKVALFDLVGGQVLQQPRWRGQLDWGTPGPTLGVAVRQGDTWQRHQEVLNPCDRPMGLQQLLDRLWSGPLRGVEHPEAIQGVGHRVVHGGDRYGQSVRVTPAVEAAIAELIPLAPVHNPANLEGIQVMATLLPHCPQVAVFDTAFHSTMPAAAYTYPGPQDWPAQGIRRYGFHGISHRYVSQRVGVLMGDGPQPLRLVTCHLGNGCSLGAVRGGQSVDTTMGFTPLEGLMMGTRSGSVDPGLVLHLLRQGMGVEQVDRLLNREAGLAGLSGVSHDLREILAAIAAGNPQAQLAFEVFTHSIRRHIGAMVASLGGIDGLVFTAGMGENSPELWRSVCEPLAFLGIHLGANLARSPQEQDISQPGSPVRVWVIPTQEEWAIAQDCRTVLGLP